MATFDLEKRTLQLSMQVIALTKLLPRTQENLVLIKQLIRSITSIGANYREANEADSRKDFIHRIRICRRENKESLYWLQLIEYSNSSFKSKIDPLIQETRELNLIFSKVVNTSLRN